jgi:hypothetical protein
MMRLAVLFVLLAIPAQAQTTYRDWMGRETGRWTTSGTTTTYYDNMGRQTGRSNASGNSTIFYDHMGRQIGRAARR